MQDFATPIYQFVYTFESDDWVRHMRMARGSSLLRIVQFAFVLLAIIMFTPILFGFGTVDLRNHLASFSGIHGLSSLAIAIIASIALEYYLFFVAFPRTYRRLSAAGHDVTVSLSDEGVSEEWALGATRIPWAGVKDLREYSGSIFLVRGPLELIHIPAHAVARVGSRSTVTDYVRAKINANG